MALAARALAEITTTTGATTNLWKLPPIIFLRSKFSTATSTPTSPTENLESKKPSKRKKTKKNLFEVAQYLPKWGIGYHMAKTHWTNVSYEITKINLYKDGRHGKAWGIAYKDGIPAEAPKKISGVHKRCWRYVPNPMIGAAAPAPTEPKAVSAAEVQAA